MANKINIVVAKNEDGYSVNFPDLDTTDYQDSSLDEVLTRLKDTLQTYLISSDLSQASTGESILKMVNKHDFTEEELSNLPTNGAEKHDYYLYGTPNNCQ